MKLKFWDIIEYEYEYRGNTQIVGVTFICYERYQWCYHNDCITLKKSEKLELVEKEYMRYWKHKTHWRETEQMEKEHFESIITKINWKLIK
jgi:hypothetical protein